jgi:hypothetical protein
MCPDEEVSSNFETNEATLMMTLGVIFSFS